MSEDANFLKELQEGFVEEALDLIDLCEQSCLNLESRINEKEEIKTIFRCIHTIKGTAAAVEMNNLAEYTHKVENLLVKLKNNELQINEQIASILLIAVDLAKKFLVYAKEGNDTIPDTSSSLLDIQAMLDSHCANLNITISAPQETILPAKDSFIDPTPLPHQEENVPRQIGEILLDEQVITDQQLDDALVEQSRKLGTVMLDNGDINPEQLAQALDKQEEEQKQFNQKPEEYVKLPLSKVDNLLDYLGEQVILQTSLNFFRQEPKRNEELISKTINQLNKITQDLQQTAISLRMFSMKSLFKKAQRIIRDTSVAMNKKVIFSKYGENTELDKAIVDELSGPLTHLIRNSVDHGIESAEDRLKCGKTAEGTVELNAFHKGGYFYLMVTDDGCGLNAEAIRKKAIKQGIINENDTLTIEEIYNLIFHSGLSTKDVATDISGRGVGMDVVKTAVEKLRGSIQVQSKLGEGTAFTIKLPLTLAIFNGMVAQVGRRKMIIPNSEIVQIINNQETQNESQLDSGSRMINVNGTVYPIIDLKSTIGIDSGHQASTNNIFLITNIDKQKYALKIEDVIGQQKVVFKKLPSNLSHLKGVSGATILGDGSVSLIIDVNKVVKTHYNYT